MAGPVLSLLFQGLQKGLQAMKTIIHLPASTNFRVKLGFKDGFPSITKGKLLEVSGAPFFSPLICKPFGKAFTQETGPVKPSLFVSWRKAYWLNLEAGYGLFRTSLVAQ